MMCLYNHSPYVLGKYVLINEIWLFMNIRFFMIVHNNSEAW